MEGNVILITQARTGSSRLPGKVLKKIEGEELLRIHLDRLKKCKLINNIIVATTENPSDDIIASLTAEWGYVCFRGSESNVLDRYYCAALTCSPPPKWVVRVTSDCPLIDPNVVDHVVSVVQSKCVDYVSNSIDETYPDGQDVEVFRFESLKNAWQNATLSSDKEHVTSFIRNNSNFQGKEMFSAHSIGTNGRYSHVRMTVDELSDFQLVEILVRSLGVERTWEEYAQYVLDNNLLEINSGIVRNIGYLNSLKKD